MDEKKSCEQCSISKQTTEMQQRKKKKKTET